MFIWKYSTTIAQLQWASLCVHDVKSLSGVLTCSALRHGYCGLFSLPTVVLMNPWARYCMSRHIFLSTPDATATPQQCGCRLDVTKWMLQICSFFCARSCLSANRASVYTVKDLSCHVVSPHIQCRQHHPFYNGLYLLLLHCVASLHAICVRYNFVLNMNYLLNIFKN